MHNSGMGNEQLDGLPAPGSWPRALALAAPQPIYRYYAYQGDTNNCGPYAVAIAANAYLSAARFDPETVALEMNRPLFKTRPLPHWVIQRVPDRATFPWGMAAYLAHYGIPARWRWQSDEALLARNLRLGLITIVLIGDPLRFRKWKYRGWGHAKVLYGYEPGHGYAFVDPGYPANPADPWAALGIFWQPRAEFLADWRRLGRMTVTVGRA